jgi:hypothetical protein
MKVDTRFDLGQRVRICVGTDVVNGMVTAIFIRGSGTAYEFSYVDGSGNPSARNVEECELEEDNGNKMGFNNGKETNTSES